MPQHSQIIKENESQENSVSPKEPLSFKQEAPSVERGEFAVEAGEAEKLPEKNLEQTPVRTAPVLPVKDDEKADVFKEAEKLRDIKFEGRKIEHLLSLAQTKGINFAIEVAKKTEDACLLDLFHDKLVEKKLHP